MAKPAPHGHLLNRKKKQDTFSVTFTSVICNVEYFAVVAENGILLLSSFQF